MAVAVQASDGALHNMASREVNRCKNQCKEEWCNHTIKCHGSWVASKGCVRMDEKKV